MRIFATRLRRIGVMEMIEELTALIEGLTAFVEELTAL
jgi:hypothetical protein